MIDWMLVRLASDPPWARRNPAWVASLLSRASDQCDPAVASKAAALFLERATDAEVATYGPGLVELHKPLKAEDRARIAAHVLARTEAPVRIDAALTVPLVAELANVKTTRDLADTLARALALLDRAEADRALQAMRALPPPSSTVAVRAMAAAGAHGAYIRACQTDPVHIHEADLASCTAKAKPELTADGLRLLLRAPTPASYGVGALASRSLRPEVAALGKKLAAAAGPGPSLPKEIVDEFLRADALAASHRTDLAPAEIRAVIARVLVGGDVEPDTVIPAYSDREAVSREEAARRDPHASQAAMQLACGRLIAWARTGDDTRTILAGARLALLPSLNPALARLALPLLDLPSTMLPIEAPARICTEPLDPCRAEALRWRLDALPEADAVRLHDAAQDDDPSWADPLAARMRIVAPREAAAIGRRIVRIGVDAEASVLRYVPTDRDHIRLFTSVLEQIGTRRSLAWLEANGASRAIDDIRRRYPTDASAAGAVSLAGESGAVSLAEPKKRP